MLKINKLKKQVPQLFGEIYFIIKQIDYRPAYRKYRTELFDLYRVYQNLCLMI